jgi:DNA-binding NarL/FixJ family response regulator
MPDAITIVLADDHPIFRNGLRDVLRADPSLQIVAEVGDGVAALQAIERHAPTLAILDVDMPQAGGLEVARTLHGRGSATRAVLLTMHDGRDMLHGALDAGVSGYVLKDGAVSEILSCVHLVAIGKVYITPAMSQHLVAVRSGTRGRPADPFAALTPAERRVVALVAEGHSTRQIAAALSLSAKTVEHHRTHACEKLGLHGPNALVRFAMEHRTHLT